MKETISLQGLLQAIKKRLGLIVLLTILAVSIAGVISYTVLTPVYKTSTQLLINSEQSDITGFSRQDIQTNLELINTYSVIIKSPAILDMVVERLDLNLSVEELESRITVDNSVNSQVLNISVHGPNPVDAVEIANVTAAAFESEIKRLMNVDNVSILSPAELEDEPLMIAPNPMLNMVIAAVVGLMIGVGIASLMEYLDTTIKTGEDIENYLELPSLGVISPIIDNGPATNLNIASKRERRESAWQSRKK